MGEYVGGEMVCMDDTWLVKDGWCAWMTRGAWKEGVGPGFTGRLAGDSHVGWTRV